MATRAKIVLTLLALVVIAFVGDIYLSGSRHLFSDPAKLRTNPGYAAAYAQPCQRPVMPGNLFERFHFQQSTTQIVVRMPFATGGHPDAIYAPLETREADASNIVTFPDGGGSIRLAFVGTMHSAPLQERVPVPGKVRTMTGQGLFRSAPAPFQLFGADSKPVTEEDVQRLLPGQRTTSVMNNSSPLARFYFTYTNMPPPRVTTLHVFDRRTKWPLGLSRSPSMGEGTFQFDVSINAWHQTPLELVVMTHTGLEEATAQVVVGAELDFSGGKIRVAAVCDEGLGEMRTERDGEIQVLEIDLLKSPRSEERPGSTIVLQTWPSAGMFQGDIVFLDKEGKELKRSGSSAVGNVRAFEMLTNLENVHAVRMRHYARTERLVFCLSELPGLPDENRGLKNLFEVRVPYAYFGSEYEFQSLVRGFLQLDGKHLALNYPNGSFPMERTNTSARELFLEMESMLTSPAAHLVANEETNVLEKRKSQVKRMLQRLRINLGL